MTVTAPGISTSADGIQQVFTFTSSATIDYTNPSGASEVADSLAINLKKDSLLIISYSVRASLTPRTSTQIPMVFVRCEVDSTPCPPDANDIVFLLPEFCCDARTFTWVFPKALKGKHSVTILWGMGNPTAAHFTLRSLVIQAAKL
jgi:hypothetical protein